MRTLDGRLTRLEGQVPVVPMLTDDERVRRIGEVLNTPGDPRIPRIMEILERCRRRRDAEGER
jgi:hypothetical protein